MRLQDILSKPATTIDPSATVTEARSIMKREGIHHLVVTKGRRITGVLSLRDLSGAAAQAAVEPRMSTDVVTASSRTTVKEAANLLRGRSIGCLPVVDAGKLVGIVTISDLLELLGKGAVRPIAESTRWTLRARGPRKARPSSDRQGLEYTR